MAESGDSLQSDTGGERRSSADASETADLGSSAGGGGWACDACTYFNEVGGDMCAMCGTPTAKRQRSSAPTSERQGQQESSDAAKKRLSAKLSRKSDNANEVVDSADDIAAMREAATADVVFHQLRSRALKVLCVYLSDKASAELIVAQRGFLPVLRLSILQTSLKEWASMEQLELRETRLMELLYDLQHQVVDIGAELTVRAVR